MTAQILLSQTHAIRIARRAEKKLSLDLDSNGDEGLDKFLSALWFDPGNAAAYAYLGLLAPHLVWLNHQNDGGLGDEASMLEEETGLETTGDNGRD